jgi:SnoaL-like domain
MSQGNAELIRAVYGFNWAAVAERERGLAASAKLLAPDAQAQVSPEIGERTLHGLEGFGLFVIGLEEDFSEFRYEAEDFAEPSIDRVVVTGHIRARGRASQMPLSARFGHIWTMKDGKAVSIVAHLDDDATAAAARPA